MKENIFILIGVFILAFSGGMIVAEQNEKISDKPNVLVITVNNLRVDHMQCNGYRKNVTPNLCEFGEENIKFTNAESQSVWTLPSTASIFLSQYPNVHGVNSMNKRISDESVTLPEVFEKEGYRTSAFVGNRICQGGHLKSRYGYSQGFDSYDEQGPWFNTSVPKAMRRIDKESNESSPFFMFVHGYDAHSPYGDMNINKSFMESYDGFLKDYVLDFGEEDDSYILDNLERRENRTFAELSNRTIRLDEEDLRYIRAKYDQDLAAADKSIGKLIQHLRDSGEYEDTIVVISSNHGTMLGERGIGNKAWGHGFPYREISNANLMMHIPGYESKTINTPVELIDLYPTLAEFSGLDLDKSQRERIQGRSLKSLIDKGNKEEIHSYAFTEGTGSSTVAIRGPDWKMIKTNDPDFDGDNIYFRLNDSKYNQVPSEDVPQSVRDNLDEEFQVWNAQNRKLERSDSVIKPNGGCNDDLLR